MEAVAARLATRGLTLDVEEFRSLDAERRAVISEAEQLKQRRNEESQAIAKLRKEGADTAERQQKVREIGDRISALDDRVN